MLKFVVNKNDADMRMDKLIKKFMPTLPTSLMYKAFRKKDIKVNGKRVDISYKPKENDVITAYLSDEFLKETEKNYDFLNSNSNINIIYEDENILLINKPQGVLCHPDKNEYKDTLLLKLQHYLYKKGEFDPENEQSFKPSLCNRIDRNTEGIVIAAKNAEALKIMCEKIKNREIDKYYLAVVHGKPKKREDTLEGFLFKDETKNQVFIDRKKTEKNRTIKTKYKVLKSKNDLSLIEVELITGRTHQIRAHMAYIGHPLLGDGKYGKLINKKYKKQALCSYKLTFSFKEDAGKLNYLKDKTFSLKEVWFEKELFSWLKIVI